MRIRNLGTSIAIDDEPGSSVAEVSPKLSRRRAYRTYLQDLAHELSRCESFTSTELPKWGEELGRLAELPSPRSEQEFVESIVAECCQPTDGGAVAPVNGVPHAKSKSSCSH